MSDVTANVVVKPNNIVVQVNNNPIKLTPNVISMSVLAAAAAYPGGINGQLQYNNNGKLNGAANTVVANGNVSFTNISNLKISGGSSGYFLQTDGAGDLTWAHGTANITGNGTAAGANNQIQLSDGTGNFKVGPAFSFDPSSNVLSAPGNGTFAGNVSANYFIGNGSQLTGLITSSINNGNSNVNVLANANVTISSAGNANIIVVTGTGANIKGTLNVTGNITAGNINAGNLLTANYSTSVLTTNTQPNITSVGTLTSLSVGGTTSIQQALEKVSPNATGATGTINYDLLSQAIILQTANATANFTLNFRGNSATTLDSIMSSNQSITCTFININGSTAYVPNVISIDSNVVTAHWAGNTGIAPAATIAGRDVYNFNIIKTAANTYTVLASGVGYV